VGPDAAIGVIEEKARESSIEDDGMEILWRPPGLCLLLNVDSNGRRRADLGKLAVDHEQRVRRVFPAKKLSWLVNEGMAIESTFYVARVVLAGGATIDDEHAREAGVVGVHQPAELVRGYPLEGFSRVKVTREGPVINRAELTHRRSLLCEGGSILKRSRSGGQTKTLRDSLPAKLALSGAFDSTTPHRTCV
jgi:hypothetical protein